jgi:hypothetical protein
MYKGFKKVSEDKHSATLRNQHGHELKIAKSQLSAKLCKDLSELPMHKAEGGSLTPDEEEALSPISSDIKYDMNTSARQWKREDRPYSPSPQATPSPQVTPAPDSDDDMINQAKKMSGSKQMMAKGGVAQSGSATYRSENLPAREWTYCPRCGKEHPNCKCGLINAQMMAEGGEPDPAPAPTDPTVGPPAPVSININAQPQPNPAPTPSGSDPEVYGPADPAQAAPAQDAVPMPAEYQPGISPPGPQATTGSNPNATPVPATSTTDTSNTPTRPPATPPASRYQPAPDPKQQAFDQMQQQTQAFQQDLVDGHIKSETMQDIMGKRDTLGKVGLLFGLLMSGAGNGMLGQPNAVYGAMQKEIDNDMMAQQNSQSNAQNLLKINQQGLMNQAQIKNLNQETATKAYALTRAQMNQAALHKLVQQAGNDPKAQAQLAMLANAVQGENYNLLDRAAAKSARFQQMGIDMAGNPVGGNGNAPVPNQAADIRRREALGLITPEQSQAALKEVAMVENKQQANQSALDSFHRVAEMQTVGYQAKNLSQTNSQIDAEWDPMLDRLTKSNEGRVTPITVDMMNGLKPKLIDSKATIALKEKKLREILNSGYATPTLDSMNMSPNKSMPDASAQPQYKIVNGIKYMRGPNGEAIKVK